MGFVARWSKPRNRPDDGPVVHVSSIMKTRYVLLLILGLSLGVYCYSRRPIRHPPGILIPQEPKQELIANPTAWEFKSCSFVPLAKFEIAARVLASETYSLGWSAEISSIDLALGWGPLSDQAIVDQLDITQSNRWYYYRWNRPVNETHLFPVWAYSSNMHMIPANAELNKQLHALRVGHLIEIQGFLVSVRGPRGETWVSSVKRTDSGDGACEIVWVDKLVVREN